MAKPKHIAKMVLEQNAGGHVLVGPALVYDGKPGCIVVIGGVTEPKTIAVDLPASSIDEARTWRDQVLAAIVSCTIDRKKSLIVHDCGDERQLIDWAVACYPGPKLEAIRAQIIAGGTA